MTYSKRNKAIGIIILAAIVILCSCKAAPEKTVESSGGQEIKSDAILSAREESRQGGEAEQVNFEAILNTLYLPQEEIDFNFSAWHGESLQIFENLPGSAKVPIVIDHGKVSEIDKTKVFTVYRMDNMESWYYTGEGMPLLHKTEPTGQDLTTFCEYSDGYTPDLFHLIEFYKNENTDGRVFISEVYFRNLLKSLEEIVLSEEVTTQLLESELDLSTTKCMMLDTLGDQETLVYFVGLFLIFYDEQDHEYILVLGPGDRNVTYGDIESKIHGEYLPPEERKSMTLSLYKLYNFSEEVFPFLQERSQFWREIYASPEYDQWVDDTAVPNIEAMEGVPNAGKAGG